MDATRTIACLIYPDVMSLDVTCPMQVFASANVERQRQGLPSHYELLFIGDEPGQVATSAGLKMVIDAGWSGVEPDGLDTLLIPGGAGVEVQKRNEPLISWLRNAEPRLRRLGSVCSGALILAEAGLLNGRKATTHWADLSALGGYSNIDVQGDRLHTYDPADPDTGHIFSSAGVTAGIDLALALVEADLGRALALSVAQRLVMFLRRPGGQTQFSPLLAASTGTAARLAALLEWIPGRLGDDLSIDALARQAHMTPRTLCRVFNQEVGMGPGQYIERVRLEAARTLLLDAQASIATVARLTGHGHPENLRRSFQKHLSVSPRDFFQRFG